MGTPLIPEWLDLSAVAVGAIQGAVFAVQNADEQKFDIVGLIAMSLAMGLGGGFIRDVLLSVPLATLQTDIYLLTVIGAGIAGAVFTTIISRLGPVIVTLDAIALGLFMGLGTMKAFYTGHEVLPTILVGVLTAAGGGVTRDILAGQSIAIFQEATFYALAALAGSIVLLVLHYLGISDAIAMLSGCVTTIMLRLISVIFDWQTPSVKRFAIGVSGIRRY
jgi:uncharacterized membrane protein YeiH